jgi:hypothetical protein
MNTCSKSLPEQRVSTRWPWPATIVRFHSSLTHYHSRAALISSIPAGSRRSWWPRARAEIAPKCGVSECPTGSKLTSGTSSESGSLFAICYSAFRKSIFAVFPKTDIMGADSGHAAVGGVSVDSRGRRIVEGSCRKGVARCVPLPAAFWLSF